MKKLKLEELEVVSFVTAPAGPAGRGTVHANAKPASQNNCTLIGCETYGCPTDARMDCTYGCTWGCPTDICESERLCAPLTELDCAPVSDLDCTIVP